MSCWAVKNMWIEDCGRYCHDVIVHFVAYLVQPVLGFFYQHPTGPPVVERLKRANQGDKCDHGQAIAALSGVARMPNTTVEAAVRASCRTSSASLRLKKLQPCPYDWVLDPGEWGRPGALTCCPARYASG